MPTRTFDFAKPEQYTFPASDLWVLPGMYAALVRKDVNGNFTPYGVCTEAEIIFPEFVAEALTEWTGMEIDWNLQGDSEVSMQISVDQGATWLWYDGANWAAVVNPSDWTDKDDCDEGIASLWSYQPTRRLLLKFRLTPSSDGGTPYLNRVAVHHELKYSFYEDISRSIKRYLDTNLIVDVKWASNNISTDVSNNFLFSPQFQTVVGVDEVYNVTSDPNRLINLFSSYNPSTKEITLTGAVVDNSIEVRYRAKTLVSLAGDENLVTSELPAVLVQVPSGDTPFLEPAYDSLEYLKSKGVYRARAHPIDEYIEIYLDCMSAIAIDAYAINSKLAQLLEPPDVEIPSLATGGSITVMKVVPLENRDKIGRAFHVKTMTVTIESERIFFAYRDRPVLQEIGLGVQGGEASAYNPVEQVQITE